MTYELAKELKEAGFPIIYDPMQDEEKGYCPAPTLSELIEACGDGIQTLYKEGDIWVATYMRTTTTDFEYFDLPVFMGNTPEEAVARLWLALNKK